MRGCNGRSGCAGIFADTHCRGTCDGSNRRHSGRGDGIRTTMLLAVDIGNTNTVLGLYRLDADAGMPPKGVAVAAKDRVDLTAHWRLTTHRTQTVDEYGVFFVKLFEMHGLSPNQVTHIIISSVVPPLDSTLRQVCETYFHIEPLFVEPGMKTG